MKVGIISNALAWTDETVENLVSLNPYAVGFSVDGEEQLHDYLRGIPGSHKKVFKYIKELNNKGVVTCAVTAVNNKNLKELVQIRNRLMVYGVDAWQLQLASPMGRMAENKDMVLNEDEHYELGKFIIETRERLPAMNVQAADCIGYFGTLENKLRNREWDGCSAGIHSIGIDSDGNVRGCLSIRTDKAIEGNIRETPLKELWMSDTTFKYNRQFSVNNLGDKCKGCNYGTQCKGGCQSQSIAFYDKFHNAPYCFLRHERGQQK
jgi:radical SAM protein with 4Fe4S-binding SPASM domain